MRSFLVSFLALSLSLWLSGSQFVGREKFQEGCETFSLPFELLSDRINAASSISEYFTAIKSERLALEIKDVALLWDNSYFNTPNIEVILASPAGTSILSKSVAPEKLKVLQGYFGTENYLINNVVAKSSSRSLPLQVEPIPDQALKSLIGENPAGFWRLIVKDENPSLKTASKGRPAFLLVKTCPAKIELQHLPKILMTA